MRIGKNSERDDTTQAKTNAVAKSDPPKPSCKPTAVAKAVTVDV